MEAPDHCPELSQIPKAKAGRTDETSAAAEPPEVLVIKEYKPLHFERLTFKKMTFFHGTGCQTY